MAIAQPKINQRKQLRYAIGLLFIAVLFFTWYFLRDFDPGNLGNVDTTGWIVALKETATGTQAVAIKPDGTIIENPQPSGPIQDRDPAWQPDGQRVYFSSNRDEKKNAFHMYRWNLAHNSVEQRTTGSRAQERPAFDVNQPDPKKPTALVISGGFVVEFNPHDGSTRQLLPPVGKGITQDGQEAGGASSQFGPEYEHLGTSFREAHYVLDRKYIVAVMRRDDGETLVLQNMEPTNEQEALPVGIVAGEHIQLSVDEKSGKVVYCVQNFDFLDREKILSDAMKDGKPSPYVQNGKLIKPYRHMLGVIDPGHPDESGAILVTKDDKICFGSPAPSPDGSIVACLVGPYDTTFSAKALVVIPLRKFDPKVPTTPTTLLEGNMSGPSWSPDGKKLTFILPGNGGTRDVYTINSDGGSLTDVTAGKGFNFESPSFSPANEVKPAGS
jgi:hypothetical protein